MAENYLKYFKHFNKVQREREREREERLRERERENESEIGREEL